MEIARRETAMAATVCVGDEINGAPAVSACTVGLAFGRTSDVTVEVAGAVNLDADLRRVDDPLRISKRFCRIAFQSAIGGIALSLIGVGAAAIGLSPPAGGAILQEGTDVLAVPNALRVTFPPRSVTDY